MDKYSNPADWQLRCEKTRERLSHLLKTKLWCDCTFMVGDEDPETVSAHKFVLAMSSPVFEAMFFGGMAEGSSPIAIPDVQPGAFKSLLEFLYTDATNMLTYNDACELYYAAKKYMIPYIQLRCVNHMLFTLLPQNACFAYEFATLFDEKELLIAAQKKIRRKTKEVLKDTNFEDIQLSTILMLVSQKRLEIDSELELFKALERFAQDHGVKNLKRSCETRDEDAKRLKLDPSQINSDECKDTMSEPNKDSDGLVDIKTIKDLRKAVSHIRFLTLSASEFAQGAAQSILLTDEEALAILLNIAGVTVPLLGLSSSKERRDVVQVPMEPPASASVGPQYEAMCIFSVYNFRTRKRPVTSGSFYTDRLCWTVRAVPGTEIRSDGAEEKCLGVFVDCTASNSWSCQARVTIELVSRNKSHLKRTFTHAYTSVLNEHGFRRLLWWDEVLNYLHANVLTIQARVAVSNITY